MLSFSRYEIVEKCAWGGGRRPILLHSTVFVLQKPYFFRACGALWEHTITLPLCAAGAKILTVFEHFPG